MKRDPHTLIKCELWNRILLDITLYMYITHTYQKRPTHIKRDPHTLLKYVLTMKRDLHTPIKCVLWKTMLLDITLHMYITLTYVCKALIKCVLKCVQICTAYEKRPTHPYQMWTVKNNVTWHHIIYVHYINIRMQSSYQMCTQMCTNMYCIWKEPHTPLSNVNCEKQCYLTSHYVHYINIRMQSPCQMCTVFTCVHCLHIWKEILHNWKQP